MKMIFLIGAIMICSIQLKAQNVSLLYQSFDFFRASGNIEKAKQYAVKLQHQLDKDLANTDTLKALYYRELANYYASIGIKDTAKIYESITNSLMQISYGKGYSFTLRSEWDILNEQAGKYYFEGNLEKAVESALQALELAEKKFGKGHPNYIISCSNLAGYYKQMGKYQKTEPLYIQIKKDKEKILGKEHLEYTSICIELGDLYQRMGNFAKAEPLMIEAKAIREKTLGKGNLDYAVSCNNLANLYVEMGNYTKSELLFLEAQKILVNSYGFKNQSYGLICNNLANLYQSMGDYAKAEPLYFEAKAIQERILGHEHTDYAKSCNNLADLYQDMGNTNKAEPLYLEAKRIFEKNLGKEHSYYAASCNNLANLYKSRSNYSEAEQLLIEAKSIVEKNFGKENPEYATCCSNLAGLYKSTGNYLKAEALYLETKSILEESLGKKHPKYASSCYNLASLYEIMGNDSKAENLYIEALNIRKNSLGREHPDYARSCTKLAELYHHDRSDSKAEPLFIEANNNLNRQIKRNFSFLTEKEKGLFIQTISENFDIYNSFALQYKNQKPDFIGLIYNNELAHKGMVLQSSKAVTEAVMSSNSQELISIYNELMVARKMLGYQYSLAIDKRTISTDSMEQVANNLEKQLLTQMQKYPELTKFSRFNRQVSWQDIQRALKPGEAAIEFIAFNFKNHISSTDSVLYCALVLRKEFLYPKMIYLFEEKQLQELLPESTGNSGAIDNLYNIEGTLSSKADGYLLYKLLWQPVDSVLLDIKTVFFSPSGLLNKISFNAIPLPDKRVLSDKYMLYNLFTTAILTGKQKPFIIGTSANAVIYGGIDYSVKIGDMLANSEKYRKPSEENEAAYRPAFPIVTTRGEVWNYLPGTLIEAQNISKLFMELKIELKLLSGQAANEESFKVLGGKNSPTILHIATHGFFMPDSKKEYSDSERLGLSSFKTSDNPLLRSGLMFAGSNAAWNNDTIPAEIEDGVLTANEISQMYLPNTRLVVLSACETGLGEIRGSEGVFGLQRSFKMAGVDNIIMSLWQVPDEQTSELMQNFYKEFLSGLTIRDAFSKAQGLLKSKYKDSPFSWAAFVLIE